MSVRRLLPLCLALSLLLLASARPASALEDLSTALPPDTMAYVRVAGVDALFAELASMPELDRDQVLLGLYKGFIEEGLGEMAQEMETEPEVLLDGLHSIQGVHFALFGLELGRYGGVEDMDLLIAIETTEPGIFEGLFEKLLKPKTSFAGEVAGTRVHALKIEEDAPNFYFAFHGNLILVSTRPDRISGVIEGRAEPQEISLAKMPKYTGSALRTGTDATVIAWVDAQRLLKMIESASSERDRREFQEASRIAELWRLQALSVVSGSGSTRARMTFSPGHRWLSAIRGSPVSGALQGYIPADAVFYAVDGGSVKEKVAALRALLTDEEVFPMAEEVKGGLLQIEDAIGFNLEELTATLGSGWAIILPREKELPIENDDGLTFLFEIGDREAFDALLDRFLVSPVAQQLEADAGQIADEDFHGARILYPDYGDDLEIPCMAVHGNVLMMGAHLDALRGAILAKVEGRSAAAVSGLPGGGTKVAALDLGTILMEESEFTPLMDLAREGLKLAAVMDEGPGRMDVHVNQPAFGFFMFMMGGETLRDRYRRERNACEENLQAVFQAIERYRAETGENPGSLHALVPEYLPKARLVCPFDHGKGIDCSYRLVEEMSEDRGDWSILAWCGHRLHGRIVLRANGEASTVRERTFIRDLFSQGVKVR